MNTQSHIYRKKIKVLTQLVKGLHPLLRRVPAPLPHLGSEANWFAKKLTAKEVTVRKEAFGKVNATRVDKEAVSYWLTPPDADYGRKVA